jgi:hypothetical protein
MRIYALIKVRRKEPMLGLGPWIVRKQGLSGVFLGGHRGALPGLMGVFLGGWNTHSWSFLSARSRISSACSWLIQWQNLLLFFRQFHHTTLVW